MEAYDLWEANERRKEKWLLSRPKCHICGDHIQEDKAIRHNGDWYCKDCEDEAWEEIRKEFLESIDE